MSFELTPGGISQAETIVSRSSPEAAVIAYMYEIARPVELSDVTGRTHMNDEKAVKVMRRLINLGYVEEI